MLLFFRKLLILSPGAFIADSGFTKKHQSLIIYLFDDLCYQTPIYGPLSIGS
jgi:hypothetical protein